MKRGLGAFFSDAAGYTADGRAPFGELYGAFSVLEKTGWVRETAAVSSRAHDGKFRSLPISSYRTKNKGNAVWIISGIHGEEPAGPNAIADGIAHIQKLGESLPVVLLPLCNPLGYAENWRYLNAPEWAQGKEVHSVGDSEHVLPGLKTPGIARAAKTSSPEAAALVRHVLELARDYPPFMAIDMHEDDKLDKGYAYSQGGRQDAAAHAIVALMSSAGIPVQKSGRTRFGERIEGGIVGRQNDGGIDELLSSAKIVLDGKVVPGPGAQTVITVETPANALPLEQRKQAHLEILKNLKPLAKMVLRP